MMFDCSRLRHPAIASGGGLAGLEKSCGPTAGLPFAVGRCGGQSLDRDTHGFWGWDTRHGLWLSERSRDNVLAGGMR